MTTTSIVSTVACIFLFLSVDAFQFTLTHDKTSMNELAEDDLRPSLTDSLLQLVIAPQTYDDTVTLELGQSTLRNASIQYIPVEFDETAQTIIFDVIHFSTIFNDILFVAEYDPGGFLPTLTCTGTLSPSSSNWNVSVVFAPETKNCNISFDLLEDQTIISEGTMILNEIFDDDVCGQVFDMFDMEALLIDLLLLELPDIINEQAQQAMDEVIADMQNQGTAVELANLGFDLCWSYITVFADNLEFVGEISIPPVEVETTQSLSTTQDEITTQENKDAIATTAEVDDWSNQSSIAMMHVIYTIVLVVSVVVVIDNSLP